MDPALVYTAPTVSGFQYFHQSSVGETSLTGETETRTAADIQTVRIDSIGLTCGNGVGLGIYCQNTGGAWMKTGEQAGEQDGTDSKSAGPAQK